jgi:hypothetical protein
MFNLLTKGLCLPLVVLIASCGDEPVPRFGFNTSGIQFEVFDTTEGIHPSDVTLDNPRNPFRQFAIGDDTKFEILDGGGNAGAFYAWATVLANIPIGENQYFAAVKLRDIYQANEVPPEQRETVRLMAINAFQAVLDCFPDSLLFDVSGEISLRLSTLAFVEITELNGVVQGDWELVTDSRGNPTAVRSTGFDTLSRDILCF